MLPLSQMTLTDAFNLVVNYSIRVKAKVSDARQACANDRMTDQGMYYIHGVLDKAVQKWNQAKTFSGLGAEFTRQYPSYTGNLGQDANAMINAAIAARDWVTTNIPAPGATPISLSSSETAEWQALAMAYENTIN